MIALTSPEVIGWFRRHRQEIGSVERLAELIGIGKNSLTDYLLGNRAPNSRTAPALADYAAKHWVEIKSGTSEKHERLELRGRAIEVQALLAYAQERLRLLTDAPYADDSAEPEANTTPSAPVAPRRSARG